MSYSQENKKNEETKDSIEENRLGQISFFQKEKTFYNNLYFSGYQNTYKVKLLDKNYHTTPNDITAYKENYEDNGAMISETISYSFFKNHLLGFNLQYASETNKLSISQTINNTYSTTNDNYETTTKGFENPIVFYGIRILEQKREEKPLNLDLKIAFSPNVFESKTAVYATSASNRKEGTVASGNSNIAGGLTLSQNISSFIWSTNLSATYVSETKQKNTYTGYNNKVDAYPYFSIGGDGQYYFSEFIGLDFGLHLSFIPSTNKTYENNGNSYDNSGNLQLKNSSIESYTAAKISLGLNLNPILNKFNLYIMINGYGTSDYNMKVKYNQVGSISPEENYKISENSSGEVIIGIKLLL
jgi:hypothetical protein